MLINKTITILTLISLIVILSQPSNVMAKATSASIDVRIVILPQPSLRSMSMDIGREDLTPIIANEENQMIIDETMVDEAMLDAENSPTEEYYQDDILVTTHRTEESIFIQFTKTE